MKIGFDIDGVLYPWHKYFYNYVSRRNEDYAKLGYEQFWMNIKSLEEENKQWLWDVVNMPSLYNKEPIDKELLVLLIALADNNNEIYYVTSRPESTHKITKVWVDRNNLPQKENLHIVSNGKKEIIETLKLKYYVEDRVENYFALKDTTRVLMIDQPWNNYGANIMYHFTDTQDALVYLINRSGIEIS